MLRDVGMDGRFSEARAREIKEQRELLADLEAVTEMNRAWGADDGRPRRTRRGVRMSLKELDSDDNGDTKPSRDTEKGKAKARALDTDGDENENGIGEAENGGMSHGEESNETDEDDFVARPRRARGPQAELAFLGDDSDSDD